MGARAGQFDMAHALAPHFRQSNFHPALLADDSAVFEPLILTAQTLVVAHGSKQLRTKQTIALWLKRPVIDGLGLLYLTERP
jgi:hypothetical protein